MSIIERRRPRMVLAAIAAALIAAPAVATDDAWWLTWQPKATATSVAGLPIVAIDPHWRRASLIDAAHLPAAARTDRGWMRKDGFTFALTGDLNRNGVPDRAVTGVYEDADGGVGRFMLVVEPRRHRTRKVFLAQEPGEPRFGVFVRRGAKAYWARCMQCGEVQEITRTPHGIALIPTD